MPNEQPLAAADQRPISGEEIEVHVTELQQLFSAIDPSPLSQRDLSQNVEDYIVSRAREAPRASALALSVHLDEPVTIADASALIRQALRTFFSERSLGSRRQLRQLLRVGRTSLVIGLLFLGLALGVGSMLESAFAGSRVGGLLRESLVIGGWVAMWRPLEIFLYEWWPIRADARLFDRLSGMSVRILKTRNAGG